MDVPGNPARLAPTETLLASGLVRHVLPHRTAEEYTHMLAQRDSRTTMMESSGQLLTDENMDILQQGMDADDYQDLVADVIRRATTTKAASRSATAASVAAPSGAAASSDAPAPPAEPEPDLLLIEDLDIPLPPEPRAREPRPFAAGLLDITLEEAKTYLPTTVSARLSLEVVWDHRWRAEYDRVAVPRVVSKKFRRD